MIIREDLIVRIDGLIEQLSSPLPSEEKNNGWTEDNRNFFLAFFKKLRAEVAAGKRVKYADSIGRGMDSRGIVEGHLLDEACSISVDLQELD
jgi:hypothetical protein